MWFCRFFYQRVKATPTWTTSRRKEHGDYFRPNTFDYWFCTQDRFAVDARDHFVVDRLVVLGARRHGPRCWWTTSLLLRGGAREMFKIAKPQSTKSDSRGHQLMIILGGVVLVAIRWSIFASREVLAGAKAQSNSSSGQSINWNSIERWVKTELSSLTTLFSKSREA